MSKWHHSKVFSTILLISICSQYKIRVNLLKIPSQNYNRYFYPHNLKIFLPYLASKIPKNSKASRRFRKDVSRNSSKKPPGLTTHKLNQLFRISKGSCRSRICFLCRKRYSKVLFANSHISSIYFLCSLPPFRFPGNS